MAQTNNPLEPIFSYSIPGNHLLQISIVKQAAEESYKKQYFCFLTLIAGEQSQNGGRTFNFNNRVTMKVDGYQISELGHALIAYARGQESIFGPFTIYVDSGKSQYGQQGSGGKSMSIQKTQNQRQNNSPMVTFFFKMGSNPALGFSISPYRALAVAEICSFISHKCMELEFTKIQATAHTGIIPNKVSSPPAYNNMMSPPPPTQTAQAPVYNNNMMTAPSQNNSPENIVNNFADGLGNMPSFDDSPF